MHTAYSSLKTEQCFVAMYSVVGGELPNQEKPHKPNERECLSRPKLKHVWMSACARPN